jgi:peptide/nickel transport system substrate-binding protein
VYPPAYYHDVLLVAQANLAAVGVNMEIEIVDGSTYHSEIRSQPGVPMTVYHFSRFPEVPVTLLQFYHGDAIPGKPNAISNFTFSEELTPLIDEALEATTNERFNEITADIQRKILEDALVHVNFALQRVVARAPHVDLGYEFRSALTNNYPNMWSISLNR